MVMPFQMKQNEVDAVFVPASAYPGVLPIFAMWADDRGWDRQLEVKVAPPVQIAQRDDLSRERAAGQQENATLTLGGQASLRQCGIADHLRLTKRLASTESSIVPIST